MNKAFYIHVGFMKTGTSYLQNEVYPHFDGEEIYYVKRNDPIHKVLENLYLSNEFNFNVQESKMKIANYVSTLNQPKVLISWEGLIGTTWTNFDNHHFIANKLKELFEIVYIIISIRKQDDIAESLYLQTLHEGYHRSIRHFLNYVEGSFQRYQPSFRFGINIDIYQFNYLQFYLNYSNIVGVNNILVLPYELLRADRIEFIERLCSFVGLQWDNDIETTIQNKKINQSYSQISAKLALVLNRLIINERNGIGIIVEKPFYKYLIKLRDKNLIFKYLSWISNKMTVRNLLQKGLDKIIYKKPRFVENEIKKMILETHKESNKALDQILNLGLAQYNYYDY